MTRIRPFDLRGKRVTVMGLGTHGGGVGAVLWLLRRGAKVTLTDLKSRRELASPLAKLPKRNLTLILGRHRRQDFQTADLILQNPGVPTDSPFLKLAARRGIPLENDASLFFLSCPFPIIGVTGSKGKTTTASLIAAILKAGRFPVSLVGVEGVPVLTALDGRTRLAYVVFELSSWRLERLSARRVSPHVAVLTNLYPDHLDRYSSFSAYVQAKASIVRFQRWNDVAVVSRDQTLTRGLGARAPGRRYWFSLHPFSEENGCFLDRDGVMTFRRAGREERILPAEAVRLLGEHNLSNVLAAVAVARISGVPRAIIRNSLRTFRGVPHRLELVRELRGVRYVNDTTATIPAATIAALKSINRPAILIAGGAEKGLDLRPLARLLSKRIRFLILLPGQASKRLARLLTDTPFSLTFAKTMDEAVIRASRFARPGDTVLLSPAATSFASFEDAFHRGEAFRRAVNRLKTST